MKFSFLVAAWEEEKIIENCIKHILSIDYPKKNVEIIVSCDPKTAKVIRKYPVKILLEKKRAGKWVALTNMLKKATGDVVIINDADCFLFPLYALYDLEKDFKANPKLGGLVFGYLKTTDEIKGNFWTFIDYLITDLSFYYRLLKYPIKDFKQATFPILTNVFRNKIKKVEAINDDAEISLKLL
ncbi:MAG: glycosyltransferase, partial [Thermodesulfobacteriota bacterium]